MFAMGGRRPAHRRLRMRLTTTRFTLFLFAFFTFSRTVSAAADPTGDAAIVHDSASATWTLMSGGTSLTLTLDPARDFSVQRLVTPSGKNWTTANLPDTFVTIGGQQLALG